ncbi:GGDEF domain-containing protein [Gottfriedia acidiceleris]|uniref:GGDEF domain-containing protein n=1 Tax=Gottfriedia acidiceleris TaxID=371036 RepID=UPI003D1ECBD9
MILKQQANHLLHKLSITDGLTGLANRRYFDEVFQIKWNEARTNQTPITIMVIDINSFKTFNDTYEHLEGDKCLQTVANAISINLLRDDDFSARYGGEEFVGILSETSEVEAVKIAEKIRNVIVDLKIPNEKSLVSPYISVSIGLVNLVPNDSIDIVEGINFADKALYLAKINGRNHVNVYTSNLEMSFVKKAL